MNKATEVIKELVDSGDAVAYFIRTHGSYEVHYWVSGNKCIRKLYGMFPHFNPKVGNHITVEEIDDDEYKSILDGTFDKNKFDAKLIKRSKRLYPYLWVDYNG